MQIGFNNDVEWEDVRFHIQTEDLGLSAAKITSQIFRGGAIVETVTVSYADQIEGLEDEEERDELIRKRMRILHKLCFRNIQQGRYGPTEPSDATSPAAGGPDTLLSESELPLDESSPVPDLSPQPEAEVEAESPETDAPAPQASAKEAADEAVEPEAEAVAVTEPTSVEELPAEIDGFAVAGEQAELGDQVADKSRGEPLDLESGDDQEQPDTGTDDSQRAAYRGLDYHEELDLPELLNRLLAS